jgi:asparagine synthase (glutamine-hydrolysing)
VKDAGELLERFHALLRESVRMRLMSDVPLGAFLSGGVDSSTVVAMMAGEMGEPLKTFSIGFEEPRFNELPFARAVAERYHTEHYEMIVRPESIDLIETIIGSFDEPFGDASAIPTYFVSKLASEHVKVVLSGDGGDEILGGYDSYATILSQNRYETLPAGLRILLGKVSKSLPDRFYGRNYLRHILLSRDERFLNYVSHISAVKNSHLLSRDLLEMMSKGETVFSHHLEEAPLSEPLSRMQYLDIHTYLPGDILVKVDRMSMAHSLEARVPLLDHVLVEFLATVPAEWKMNGNERKVLIKRIASDYLPPENLCRNKQGFGVPLRTWFREDLNSYVRGILLDTRSLQRGYFNRSSLESLLQEHDKSRRDHSALLWHLLVLELWHRLYMDEPEGRKNG